VRHFHGDENCLAPTRSGMASFAVLGRCAVEGTDHDCLALPRSLGFDWVSYGAISLKIFSIKLTPNSAVGHCAAARNLRTIFTFILRMEKSMGD